MSTPLSPTERTRLRRSRERARTDRAELYAVLDEGMICHLGVVVDGSPRVIPTAYGRDGDTLYLHGSTGAASLRSAVRDVCVTVTHMDALVVSRSLFHHSINYRSAVVFGTPRALTSTADKLTALKAITDHLVPGQWDALRPPSPKELAATALLALPLDEASVKVRQGPPLDDEEDYALPVWAGEIPVRQTFGTPVPDPRLNPGIPFPDHLTR